MPKISVGRDEEDRQERGLKGTGVIGKHLVGENEEAHQANPIHFDLARPHVMGIFGKRGTGKCLLPDEKVITSEGLERVDEVFKRIRSDGIPEIDNKDEELFIAGDEEVASVDDDLNAEEKSIAAGYRKKVDEELLKIKTRSGREITVTTEHPLLTVDGWTDASEIDEGRRIGVPRRLSLSFSEGKLEIPEEFEKADYSSLNQRENRLLASKGGTIAELTDGSGSFYRLIQDAEEKGLIQTKGKTVQVTEKGEKKLRERRTSEHYRYGKSKPIRLPEKTGEDIAEFLAYLIAEGHEQRRSPNKYRLIFTNKNKKFIERFNELAEKLFDIETREMDENSVYADSLALGKFLEENGYRIGENSFDKNIPDFLVRAEEATVSKFLQKFFDCEANVTNQQIDLMTASEEIANTLSYMLLRFGIVARISEKKKYAANTEEQRVRTYRQLTVSGSRNLQKFQEKIDFSLERKSAKLESIIKESNTNVDTVKCHETLRKVRKKIGADRTQVADHKQSLKAYEDGKYAPGRKKLGEIINNLREHLEEIQNLKEELENNPSIEKAEETVDKSSILWKELNEKLGYSRTDKKLLSYKKFQENPEKIAEPVLNLFEEKHDLREAKNLLEELRKLKTSDVFWDEVEEINKVNYEGWVYDLTVKENHSFTAGLGGIYCHNSYSLGVLAEEIQSSDVSDNLSSIIIDPMGIYWSMKRPNDRATSMLEDWNLKPDAFDIQVFIPEGKVERFEEREMPYDDTFTLNPGDLSAQEWKMALELETDSEAAFLLERVVSKLTEEFGNDYSLENIKNLVPKFEYPEEVERKLKNRLMNAGDWGIFGEESSLDKLTRRGELSVVDVSVFGEMGSGWSVRSLVVGLLAKKILKRRMTARRIEEIDEMEGINENEMPIVWMFIDEAHEFLPADGETAASHPLMRWVKIGREPGVSLCMATQQPAKLHPDALSQSDIILSHRLTSKQDIDALGNIMHTYMRHDIQHYIDALPDRTGTGLLLDDNSERIYPLQVRPRKSWHAGGTPDAFED